MIRVHKFHVPSFTEAGLLFILIHFGVPPFIERDDSYLVIRAFLLPDETDALFSRSRLLLDQFSLQDHPLVRLLVIFHLSSPNPHYARGAPSIHKTKFTTGDDDHVGDDYFLTSGDKIRYFLEQDAINGQGNLTREKHRAVNKIGHGLSCSLTRLRLVPPKAM